jgi:Flp pilus assembly protein TadG
MIRNETEQREAKSMPRWLKACLRLAPLWSTGRNLRGEEGASLVEMALACSTLLLMLFGIIETSIGLYTYHYVADAAREGSRWAMVRGSLCSTNTPGLDHCNASSSDISTYVKSLGYWHNDSNMTVSATWATPTTSGTPATATWSACTTGTCNQPGFMVIVTVTEAFPLSIPYWKATTLNLTSTSRMVISQ